MALLRIKNGAEAGMAFTLGSGTLRIGRAEGSHVQLGELSVSGCHCEAALDKNGDLIQSRTLKRLGSCEIGIGIDCGEALHGFVGNADRLEYVVVGEVANLVSRYCAAAAKGEVLISPEVHGHGFNLFRADRVEIPTKHEGSLVAHRIKPPD